MAQTNEHGRIIAAVAKSALAPLGFRRKGASRVWLADHGFWLDVVEFQPSGFSKGSYCNVAVHWLWGRCQPKIAGYRVSASAPHFLGSRQGPQRQSARRRTTRTTDDRLSLPPEP